MTAQAAPADARQPGAYQWLNSYPKGVDWGQKFAPTPLYQLLDDAVAKYAARPCTNFLGKVLTYGDIGRMVDQAAAGLQKLGVKKGTKVGLFMPNCPTFIVYYFATLKAGGTVVNYNPLYTLEELTFQVKDSETEMMVTLDLKLLFDKVEGLMKAGTLKRAIVASFPALLPGAKSVLFKLFKGKDLAHPMKSPVAANVIAEADVRKNDGKYQKPAIDPFDDIAVLQYTGGTTGTPKGAMLTHANVATNCRQGAAWATASSGGQGAHLGGAAVLPRVRHDRGDELRHRLRRRDRHHAALRARRRHEADRQDQAHGHAGRADHVHRHAEPSQARRASISPRSSSASRAARRCRSRSSRSSRSSPAASWWKAMASPRPRPVVTCNPLEGPVKEGSIGQPLPGTIVSLRDLDDPSKEVAQGEKGEICIKGPQVMKGYWKRPEETANQHVGDYLRTGDVGIMDEEGFIFIVDRIKDLIICSGYNVYPRRIEEAIYEHPAVEEVTVIGINDGYRGEAPKAFIKLRAGATATEADIRKHLEAKISKIEMPAEIEFRDALPKTMIGKLSKKELKAEEAARQKAKAK